MGIWNFVKIYIFKILVALLCEFTIIISLSLIIMHLIMLIRIVIGTR